MNLSRYELKLLSLRLILRLLQVIYHMKCKVLTGFKYHLKNSESEALARLSSSAANSCGTGLSIRSA